MKTEQILPTTGAFALGFLLAMLAFALIFIPQYQREVAHSHWADAVIEECQDYYPDFYDTIGEGDNWDNYINSSK